MPTIKIKLLQPEDISFADGKDSSEGHYRGLVTCISAKGKKVYCLFIELNIPIRFGQRDIKTVILEARLGNHPIEEVFSGKDTLVNIYCMPPKVIFSDDMEINFKKLTGFAQGRIYEL